MRIGQGFDVHKLVKGRNLIIGGVKIPYEFGLLGHSDADVLVHAIMDSILGAMAKKDIGYHFPDTDDKYKNIDSMLLLDKVYEIMREEKYIINNVDCTISCQEPKLAPYIDQMRKNISKILRTNLENISIKATTTEGLGYEGEGLGISAQAICLILKEK